MSQGFTRGVPIDTDPNLSLDSDLVVPSQKAVKDYIDTGLNTKQDTITLTTTGTSGPATLTGATLNIPQYGGGSGGNSIASLSASSGDVSAAAVTSSETNVVATLKNNLRTGTFGVTVDGVTTVVQVGTVGYVVMPYDGTITGWSITANVSGNIQFDIWKATNAIPTSANTEIPLPANRPKLTSQQYVNSTTLTGWTTSFLANDVYGFYVDSASTIKNATLTIKTTKT